MLRFFYEFRHIFSTLASPQGLGQSLKDPPQALNVMPSVKDPSEMFHDRNQRDITVGFEGGEGLVDEAGSPLGRFEVHISRSLCTWTTRVYRKDGAVVPKQQIELRSINSERHIFVSSSYNTTIELSPIARMFSALVRCIYLGPFRNAVNIGGAGDYYDIQIGQPFITSWRRLKTGNQKGLSESTYRLTDDIQRIFGFDRLEINASDDNENLLLMVDGKTYKQSEMGSGLIQFIIVLVNAAIKKPSFILIDEPEQNLHPSLQVDFLMTLASYAEHGVFFATHNLGLARAVSDKVYSVRRVGAYGREVRDFGATPALAEFLGEIGFNAYQELGFETVLLVEGPTDVTCLQQFLRLYRKEHKIVLIHLGGSATINAASETQLSEITRVSRRVCALVDSERSRAGEALSADRKGFAEACSKLNISCTILERRSIENYLSEQAIRTAKGSDKYRALAPYESLRSLDPAWSKHENWRIARMMTKEEIRGSDLDTFLEQL